MSRDAYAICYGSVYIALSLFLLAKTAETLVRCWLAMRKDDVIPVRALRK